jgi:5-(carboxyamino)imidazole ribonucleotide mutase
MPKGVPVASMAVNGAYNAGLLAGQILSTHDRTLKKKIMKHKLSLNKKVSKDRKSLSNLGIKHFLRTSK